MGAGGRSGFGQNRQANPQAEAPRRNDISAKVPVNVALEGGRIAVELPSGKTVRVGIPKGVIDGQQIRVTDDDVQVHELHPLQTHQ